MFHCSWSLIEGGMGMGNLPYEQRQEKYRNAVLKVLYDHRGRQVPAREISNDLCDAEIFLSPREVVSLIHQDPELERKLNIEFRRSGSWCAMLYSLKNGYDE